MHPAIIIGTVRSLIADMAMWQIPRSTERISSCIMYFTDFVNIFMLPHWWIKIYIFPKFGAKDYEDKQRDRQKSYKNRSRNAFIINHLIACQDRNCWNTLHLCERNETVNNMINIHVYNCKDIKEFFRQKNKLYKDSKIIRLHYTGKVYWNNL